MLVLTLRDVFGLVVLGLFILFYLASFTYNKISDARRKEPTSPKPEGGE